MIFLSFYDGEIAKIIDTKMKRAEIIPHQNPIDLEFSYMKTLSGSGLNSELKL